MSNPKFTPGPWNYNAVLQILSHGQGVGSAHERDEANARLIAQAPAMYEALEFANGLLSKLRAGHGDREDVMEAVLLELQVILAAVKGKE